MSSVVIAHPFRGCSWDTDRSARDKMTTKKHFKRRVRSRSAQTGEPYATAHRPPEDDVSVEDRWPGCSRPPEADRDLDAHAWGPPQASRTGRGLHVHHQVERRADLPALGRHRLGRKRRRPGVHVSPRRQPGGALRAMDWRGRLLGRRLEAALRKGGLEPPVDMGFARSRANLRRLLCDLLEECGRLTGHADILGEAVDGRVGEDLPSDWRPRGPA